MMPAWGDRNYSKIDLPEINNILFYPRHDPVGILANQYIQSAMIPVSNGGAISAIWTETEKSSSGSILFFHGNGELASEYIDVAAIFRQMSIRFICVDYRGYGLSLGNPGISLMIEDAHDIFKYVRDRLEDKKETFIIMGRSLGCVSALEIADTYGDKIDGLIIESGFAETLPLLETLGADFDSLKIREEDGFANIGKIKNFSKPLLIIHAEDDFLIPVNQAEKLFAAANTPQKKLLKIPNAGHNDIFFTGMKSYLKAVKELMEVAAKRKTANFC
jgi:pimeloyl-ACP methyl ester carboxylesterase